MPYNVTAVEVHATGLRLPTHLGLTEDGQLLVSEFAGRAVRDVSKAGDFSDCRKGVHTAGLAHPGGILPHGDRILVADSGGGKIFDITKAGPAERNDIVSDGFPSPYGLVEFAGRLLVSYFEKGSLGIAEVSAGARFDRKKSHVSDFPCSTTAEPFPQVEAYGGSWPTARKGDQLLLGHSSLGTVWDVTRGGNFDKLRNSRFAWGLNAPGGMIADPLDEDLYVVERRSGVVRRLSEPGYARFSEPLLAGFEEPSCLRFTTDGRQLFVADKAWGAVYRVSLERVER